MFYLCDIIIDNAPSFSQNSIADKQSMQQAEGGYLPTMAFWAIYSSNVRRSETFIMRVIIQMKILQAESFGVFVIDSRVTKQRHSISLSCILKCRVSVSSTFLFSSACKWLLCSLHRKST
jgi:hypothetical protein